MRLTGIYGVVGAVVVASFVGVAGMSLAEDMNPIKDRQALMKATGAGAKVLGGMLDGSAKFDAAAATEALTAMNKAGTAFSGADFDKLFPATSKDGDTTAAPAIWEKTDDFKAKAKKFADDATAAIEAAKKDEASFKAAAGTVFGNCKGCHETYRVKKG